MGKVLHKKIKGMSLAAKAALISLFTLLLTLGLYQGWERLSFAAITGQSTWLSAYANTAFPSSATLATLTVPAGSNRLLVVAVSSTTSAVGAVTITNGAGTAGTTPSVGGKSLTLAAGDAATTTNKTHTAVYYLKEADIAAMSGSALSLRVANSALTSRYNTVNYRVYSGVDQAAPITDAKNVSSIAASTAVGPFSPALSVGANDQALEIVSLTPSTTTTTARTVTTWAATWPTSGITATNTTTLANNIYVRERSAAATATTDTSQHTASATGTYKSMTAISMKAAATTTTLTVSANTPINPTGSRLDTDTGVLMQRVQVTGSGALELNSLTLNDIGSVNTIAAAQIYISPTAATVLPIDAVLVASATNWGGSSTQFSLTGGTTANRSLGGTEPLTKYIYISFDMSVGQATKTVQSSVSAVGVAAPNISATGLSFNSNLITLAYSGNVMQTTAPLTGASSAKDSDAAVVMQHIKVDCDQAWDNALELNSLTLQDLGSATMVSGVKIYVSSTSDPNQAVLPSNAVLVGQITDWNKASTSIPLVNDYGATSGDRTVLAGTSKYLYVVYTMYYPDDLDVVWADQASKLTTATVKSQITAVGSSSPDTGATGLAYTSNLIQLYRGTWSKITSCGGCHDTANILDESGRNTTVLHGRDGRFPGSHYKHSNVLAYDCSVCHSKPTTYNHANGFINFSGQLSGDKYSLSGKNGDPVNTKLRTNTTTLGTCSNTTCHGAGPSAQWGSGPLPSDCSGCHGNKQTGATATTLSGLHDLHLNPTNNPGLGANSLNCVDCHSLTVSDNLTISAAGAAKHMNGVADYAGAMAGSYSAATKTCSSVYCHSSGLADGVNIYTNPAAAWSNGAATLGCNGCHGTGNASGSPDYTNGGSGAATANSHPAHIKPGINCSSCHSTTVDASGANLLPGSNTHINKVKDVASAQMTGYNPATKTCSNVSCHSSGSNQAVWGAAGGCGICHALSSLSAGHKFHVYTSAIYTPTAYTNLTGNRTIATRKDYNFSCANCHPMVKGTTHANGTPDVELAPVAGNGTLRALNGAAAAYNATTKVCSSVYCHSNGGSGTQVALTFYDSPAWDKTYTGDKCAMCHGNTPNSGGKVGSPAHYSTNWLGFDNNSGGHGIGIHAKSVYAGLNGTTSYANGVLAAGTAAANNHGNTAASTTLSCNVCHNLTMTTAANDHNTMCMKCHTGTGIQHNPAGDDMNLIANAALHVNGKVEVQFAMAGYKSKAQAGATTFNLISTSWTRTNGYKTSGGTSYDLAQTGTGASYNSADASCANIACHNNVRKPATVVKWGDVNGATSCASCHTPL
jgi:predicted CxxxxCH...CXXCH cytochrome family protein